MAKTKAEKPLPDISTPEGIQEVVIRANDGDESVRLLAMRALYKTPDGPHLLESFGNSFSHAADALAKHAAGANFMVQEALRFKIDVLADKLAGLHPTPLETILCQRIALAFFEANEMDRRFNDFTDLTINQSYLRLERKDRAARRLLAACKTLAMVRKLTSGLPAVQVTVNNSLTVEAPEPAPNPAGLMDLLTARGGAN